MLFGICKCYFVVNFTILVQVFFFKLFSFASASAILKLKQRLLILLIVNSTNLDFFKSGWNGIESVICHEFIIIFVTNCKIKLLPQSNNLDSCIHNWPLQSVSQDCGIVSRTTPVVSINFIREVVIWIVRSVSRNAKMLLLNLQEHGN